MKIAVLGDIHSNVYALEAVLEHVTRWKPDAVMVTGDVVNRGPDPVRCFRRIQEGWERQGWRVIRGNHEDFLATLAGSNGFRAGWEAEVHRHSMWTLHRLGDAWRQLTVWPHAEEVRTDDGQVVRMVHASTKHNRHGLYDSMSDAELRHGMSMEPAVLCVGHTHMPFVRQIGDTILLNAGAVGLPFDRDSRACFAQVELKAGRWHTQIVRVDYDRAAAEQAFFTSGYMEEGGPMVPLILDELRHARPRLRQWHNEYEALVVAGAMTVEESVRAQLAGA